MYTESYLLGSPLNLSAGGTVIARVARSEVFDPREVSVLHCINRCVRACHLCGYDPLAGIDYDHRKLWIEQRLQFLAGSFAIDVLGFAVLSNHFHVILCNRPDIVDGWSDTEAALLACSVYVDLNPLRAGCCQTPEPSQHTSARQRIDQLQTTGEEVAGAVGVAA